MILPNPTRERLSGKVRGRRQSLTEKVIMEVEVIVQTTSNRLLSPPPPGCFDEKDWYIKEKKRIEESWRETHRYWRDAKAEEVLIANEYDLTEVIQNNHTT